MLNRREAFASVAAIMGAGAAVRAVEHKPDEPKVLFYVLESPESYEDPSEDLVMRLRNRFHDIVGDNGPRLLILAPGCTLKKCTEIEEIESGKMAVESD